MWKKIIVGIVIAFLVAGGIYWFTYTKELHTPVSEAINAIPCNAAIIFESKQSKNTWKKLAQANIMWEELLGTETFAKLNFETHYIDSLIQTNAAVSQLLDNRSVFISAHVSGATTFDFLFVYSLPNSRYKSIIDEFIKTINNNSTPSYREYAGEDIATIHPSKKDSISYAYLNGILMMSCKQNLVEDAIRQQQSGISLAKDKNFSKVINTAGKNVDANVYVNYKNFPSILNHFISPNFKKEIASLADLANCSGWDVSVKSNALMLNGFTQAEDSSTSFLNLFREQKTRKIELTKIIPSKTALLLWFGIDNMKTFHHRYKKYLNALSQGRATSYEQYIESLNKKYGINIEHSMLEWMDNEMALVITEPSSNDFTNNSFAVIHSDNIENAISTLNGLSDSINKKRQPHPAEPILKSTKEKERYPTNHKVTNPLIGTSPNKSDREKLQLGCVYRNHTIRYLNLPKLLPQLLGWQFNKIINNYYTAIDDYIVFANTKDALQNFIDDFENNKILAEEKNYKVFSENISTEASMYLYSSIARSTNIYSTFVTEDLAKDIETKLNLFHKFEAVGIQFSTANKLFYSTAYLKYNPKFKQESGTMWESKLDTTISSKPFIVINHTTKEKEIIVQDDANKIYLISATGKIIWTRQLQEKIMSDMVQIDVLKNNKLQLLFNTRTAIYLCDRNGKDMKDFPVRLESLATNAISVVDYEKNRDYRIFVACENKKIRCFKTTGEEVKGFNFNKTEARVYLPLQYVKIENKDILCAIDMNGKIYLLNRQGEQFMTLREKFTPSIRNFFIEVGKDFGKSTIIAADTLGNIIKLSFTGNKEIIKMDDFETSPFFEYKDINNDTIKEYIFLTRKELKVFSQNKSTLLSYEFKENISQAPLFFPFPDGTGKIGVLSEMTNELYLFDATGSLYNGFPLEGKTPFNIGVLNKENKCNIITGFDNTIYLYQLD